MNNYIGKMNKFVDELLSHDPTYIDQRRSLILNHDYDRLGEIYVDKIESTPGYDDIDKDLLIEYITDMLGILMENDGTNVYTNDRGEKYLYWEIVIPNICVPYGENDRYGKLIHSLAPVNGGVVVNGSSYNDTPLSEINKYELVILYHIMMDDGNVKRELNKRILSKLNEDNRPKLMKFNEMVSQIKNIR